MRFILVAALAGAFVGGVITAPPIAKADDKTVAAAQVAADDSKDKCKSNGQKDKDKDKCKSDN